MTLAEACCCLLGNRKKRKKKRSRAAQCRLSNTWVFGVVRTLSDRSICAHGVINNVSKRQKPFSLSVMADDARLILSFRNCLQYPPVKASEPFEITSSLHFTFVIHTWFQLNNRADNSTGFDVDFFGFTVYDADGNTWTQIWPDVRVSTSNGVPNFLLGRSETAWRAASLRASWQIREHTTSFGKLQVRCIPRLLLHASYVASFLRLVDYAYVRARINVVDQISLSLFILESRVQCVTLLDGDISSIGMNIVCEYLGDSKQHQAPCYLDSMLTNADHNWGCAFQKRESTSITHA